MNKMAKAWAYSLFLIICLSSCSPISKERYLNSFEKFVEHIESCESINPEEFTLIKKEYLDYTETYYYKFEKELTEDDMDLIADLKVRYYKVVAKHEMRDVENALMDLKEKANEFINHIIE